MVKQINNNNILVSVICTAYNHEKYIEEAIKGIVSQETNFKYEIIVHDDASTDRTADIIREYEKKYPEIIRPIYQKENQQSIGIDKYKNFILPISRGKYLALCEGDDYWCDCNKLQMQIDFLEKHEEYSSCCTNSLVINDETGEKSQFNAMDQDYDISIEEVVCNGGWHIYQISSLVYRKELAFKRIEEKPPIFGVEKNVGDYPLRIFLLMNGKTRYFGQKMAVYRAFSSGSWTKAFQAYTEDERAERYKTLIRLLREVDKYTAERCHDGIEKDINKYEMTIANMTGDFQLYRKALSSPYNLQSKEIKSKIKILLGEIYGVHWRKQYEKRKRRNEKNM